MAAIGRPLTFDQSEVSALLDLKISDRRSYAVLATLFGTDDTAPMHIDHIFPHVNMTEAKFRQAGVADDESLEACLAGTDRLANLQLLDGAMNTSKQARAPRE